MIQMFADVSKFLYARGGFTLITALVALVCAIVNATPAGATPSVFTLATTNLLEGPGSGKDSAFLFAQVPTSAWTASTNASWLHLTVSSGTGSASVGFTFDANPGVTRSNTITIAGLLVTVTQAGTNYSGAPEPSLALPVSGLNLPGGVAVDRAGNVYIADANNNAIKKWSPTNNSMTVLITNGLSAPYGVAVDVAGNVYIADTGNTSIKRWSVVDGSITTLVSGLGGPFGLGGNYGIAVDVASNVYFSEYYNYPYVATNNFVKRWSPTNNAVTLLVSNGLNQPWGLAVDIAGNVYIADTGNSAIKKWTAATGGVSTLMFSGIYWPYGVAVDGGGNVYYVFNPQNSTVGQVQKLMVAQNTYATVASSGLGGPEGMAVDAAGNIFIADTSHNLVKELPHALLDARPRFEAAGAGMDTLPVVLPATTSLAPPFGPVSDQSWLTVAGVTNGVVSLAFTANPGLQRTAHISLLGASIPITQNAHPWLLAASSALEGPAAGVDSIVLSAKPETTAWTATANTNWLHLDPAYQAGTGSTSVVFSFDANSGATRSGTLRIGDQTFTVVQAGTTYTAIPSQVTALGTSGLASSMINSVAVDGLGNVFIAEPTFSVQRWSPTNNAIVQVVSKSFLGSPYGVAVDAAGMVYVADSKTNVVGKWSPVDRSYTFLVSSGLNGPKGVAVDASGNVYIADTKNNAVEKWSITNATVSTLVGSGLKSPCGVAVDAAGNVYIADTGNSAVKKWSSTDGSVTALVASGLNAPQGVAVDSAGNVYIADTLNGVIKKWSAAAQTVVTLVSSLGSPTGVAVDGAGNLYIADFFSGAIKVVPTAWVDPTPVSEGPAGGADTLPPLLPASVNLQVPFAPVSDQSWLTATSTAPGSVAFSFNPATTNRTARITVLGQAVAVSQAAPPVLQAPVVLGGGRLQLNFTNSPRASFTVLSATNVALPLTNWTVLGTPTNAAPGWFQFTTPGSSNEPQRFFQIRSP